MAATTYIGNVNVTGQHWGSLIDAHGRSLEPMHILQCDSAKLREKSTNSVIIKYIYT